MLETRREGRAAGFVRAKVLAGSFGGSDGPSEAKTSRQAIASNPGPSRPTFRQTTPAVLDCRPKRATARPHDGVLAHKG